jgi:predicted membrane channel-forming protein YqfA (hemolysin III family)
VLNEFWATAPTSYKVLVFSAMGLIAVGIVLNIAGNSSGNPGLAMASLAVIGLGLVLHIAGIVVRGQHIRKSYRNKP